MKRYWIIEGWNSTKKLYEHKINAGQISQRKMESLIKALTAKLALTEKEIIGSYANNRTKIRLNHLEVQVSTGNTFALSCGSNPYVVARIKEENS